MPVQRRGVETVDSGRVQRLIENDQHLKETASTAENAVRDLAETRQSQKSVMQTCGTSKHADLKRTLGSVIRNQSLLFF